MTAVNKILESTNLVKTNKISIADGCGSADSFALQLKNVQDNEAQSFRDRQTAQESGPLTRAKNSADSLPGASKSTSSAPIQDKAAKAETSEKSPEATSEDPVSMVTADISAVDIATGDPSNILGILSENIIDVAAPIGPSIAFDDMEVTLLAADISVDVVLSDISKFQGELQNDSRLVQDAVFFDDIGLSKINMEVHAGDEADGEITGDEILRAAEGNVPEVFKSERVGGAAFDTLKKIDHIATKKDATITVGIFPEVSDEKVVAVQNLEEEEIENISLSMEEGVELNEELMMFPVAATIMPVQREVVATIIPALLEKENKGALGEVGLTEEQLQLGDNPEYTRNETPSILDGMMNEDASLDVASNIVAAQEKGGAEVLDDASKHDSRDSSSHHADPALFGNIGIGAAESLGGDYELEHVILEDATHTAGKADYVIGTTLRDLSTGNVKFAEMMAGGSEVQTPAEQISIRVKEAIASGNQKMVISLTPENLGKVEITLDISKGVVKDIRITTHKMETLDAILKDSVVLEQTVREILKSEVDLSFSYRNNDSNSGGFAHDNNSEKASSHYKKTSIAVSNNTIPRRENIVTEDMVDVSI